MKVLVTGAGGRLGTSLLRLMKNKFDIFASDINELPNITKDLKYYCLDTTDKQRTKEVLEKIKPDLVIHLAALTDLEKCEKDRELAKKINADSVSNIALCCKKNNIKLLFTSTDHIFDGKKGNYTELDKPNPLNYYGMTKVIAEESVRKLKQHLILRTTFFSWQNGFEQWLIDSLMNKKQVNVVDDQYYSPLFVDDLARIMIAMIQKDLLGTYNAALGKRISRYDFAIALAKTFNLSKSLINKVSTEKLYSIIQQKGFQVPNDVSLDVSKLKKTGIRIPSLSDCLKHMEDTEKIYC